MPNRLNKSDFMYKINNNSTWGGKDLYQQRFVNYKGKPLGVSEKYTEILAEELYNGSILINTSGNNYTAFTEKVTTGPLHNHAEVKYTPYKQNDKKRNEENIAKRMFQKGCSTLGNLENFSVVDYQVPVIRNYKSHAGKIDLILTSDYVAWIGELKDDRSDESLLRAVLEVETYFQKVSHQKLMTCYKKGSVGKAILIFKNTRPYEEFHSKDNKWTKKLLNKLDIIVFLVESKWSLKDVPPQKNEFNISIIN